MIQAFTYWHEHLMNPDRIPVLLASLLLTMLVGVLTGPLAGTARPLVWLALAGLFGRAGERLDRKHRKTADLMLRGFVLTVPAFFTALAAGFGFEALAARYPVNGLTEVILLSLLLSSGAVWFVLLRLYFAMERGTVGSGAYYAIAHTARRNLAAGDDYGITRTAIGLAVRSFNKGLVAPGIWFLIGGFPAALIYSALAALAWRFGKDGFHSGFAAIPMALEKLMGVVPSVFAALLLTGAAAVTPTARTHKAVAAWWARTGYEQGGLPLAVMAWALNVSLGGAAQDITGSAIKGPWAGPGTASAQTGHKDLRRALYMNVTAHLLFIAALSGVYYVWAS